MGEAASQGWEEQRYEAPYLPASLLAIDGAPPTPALASAYDAAHAPTVALGLPSLWPCASVSLLARIFTTVQLAWNERGLHALYRIVGPFRPAQDDAHDKATINGDSRVELFVCPDAQQQPFCYRAYEFNSAGRVLDFIATLRPPAQAQLDFSYSGHAEGVMQDGDDAAGQDATDRLYRISVPWRDLGLDGDVTAAGLLQHAANRLKVGLYRAEAIPDNTELLWTSWIDPLLSDISFHTMRTFACLQLQPPPA